MARISCGVGSITIPPTLVIGANGFIGRAVVDALALADPTSVRAGMRSGAIGPHFSHSGADVVGCDLNDASSLRSAMADRSVVIHCARDAINERGREADGIVSLIDGAKQSGVERLIYLSSVAVYGQVSGVVTESTPPTPPILPYGENKLRAEKVCEAAATKDFRVVVLRPALVYGPYGEEWTVRFVRDLAGGRLTRLGPAGEGIANLVYIDDLARFCVRLTMDNIEPFTLLNVNGDDHPSFNQYFERMSAALGFGSLPKPDALYYHEARRYIRRLLRAGFKHQRWIVPPVLSQTILGRVQKRLETRYAYNHWDQCLTVRPSEVLFSNEASKQHGFVSRISLDDGLRAVEKWAREEGLIP
jgi:nucleoside-diphosphate-sugar epimerase